MIQRLTLAFDCDFRRPTQVAIRVRELRAQCTSAEWAMLEALAMEVLRQAAVDAETVHSVARLGLEAPGGR